MALSITGLKKGTIFQMDGVPYRVTEYSQKVMGRGGSTVNVKIKSLIDGKVLSKTFHGNDSVDSANVTTRSVQFLYKDSEYHFMDPSSFEQLSLASQGSEDLDKFIKEGDEVKLQLFEGSPIGVDLPKNVALRVTHAEHAVKGDTSSSITKEVTVETGLVVKAPAFIKTGDVISIDTSTGTYRERVRG